MEVVGRVLLVAVTIGLLFEFTVGCLKKTEPVPRVPHTTTKPDASQRPTDVKPTDGKPTDSTIQTTTYGLPSNLRTENCIRNDSFYNLCYNGMCKVDVNIEESTRYSYCLCSEKYEGKYCHLTKKPKLTTSSLIAVAIVASALLIILVTVLIYMWRTRHDLRRTKWNLGKTTSNQFSQSTSHPSMSNGSPEQIELLDRRGV